MTEKEEHPIHCLNCGKHLRGRYCSNCGQDSRDHQDSMLHLLKHFFSDITHYDNQLWKTIKPLLTSPGFLTLEYLKGKRASYLNPVRLFIFLNFILFLLMAWLPKLRHDDNKKHVVVVKIGDKDGFTMARYDSVQNVLPYAKRDGPFKRAVIRKIAGNAERLNADPKFMSEMLEIFMHNMARLTFLFLIVCACLLKLFYYRRHLLMVNHALFAIHLSCTFLLLSVIMLAAAYLPLGDYLFSAVFLYGIYYFYRALMLVYRQSFLKTGVKFIAISFLLTVTMGMSILANMLFALWSVNG